MLSEWVPAGDCNLVYPSNLAWCFTFNCTILFRKKKFIQTMQVTFLSKIGPNSQILGTSRKQALILAQNLGNTRSQHTQKWPLRRSPILTSPHTLDGRWCILRLHPYPVSARSNTSTATPESSPTPCPRSSASSSSMATGSHLCVCAR